MCGKSAMMGELRQTFITNNQLITKDVELKTSTYLVLQNRTTLKAEAHPLQCYWYLETSFFERTKQSFYKNSLPLAMCFREKISSYVGCESRFFFHFEEKTNVQVIGQKTGF